MLAALARRAARQQRGIKHVVGSDGVTSTRQAVKRTPAATLDSLGIPREELPEFVRVGADGNTLEVVDVDLEAARERSYTSRFAVEKQEKSPAAKLDFSATFEPVRMKHVRPQPRYAVPTVPLASEEAPPAYAVMSINSRENVEMQQHKLTVGDVFMTRPYKVWTADGVQRRVVPGERVEFHSVLLLGTLDETLIGRPVLPGAKVVCRCEESMVTAPMVVFKKRSKKNSRSKKLDRQPVSVWSVQDIVFPEEHKDMLPAEANGSVAAATPNFKADLEAALVSAH